MATDMQRSKERRWVLLGIDGSYVTLGRASDPSEEEVRGFEDALRAKGLSGWLAAMEGNPSVGVVPRLIEVRPLGRPDVPFADAATACAQAITARRAANAGR